MTELKRCPFCKSKEVEVDSNDDYCFGRCRDCNALGSHIELDPYSESYQNGDIDKEINQATEAWNTRHEPQNDRCGNLLSFVTLIADIKEREFTKEYGDLAEKILKELYADAAEELLKELGA